MKALLAAGGLALALLPMCKPNAGSTATTPAASPASPAEVRAQLAILRDSADANWTRMTRSDDRKLADMQALTKDLDKLPGHDRAQLATLRQATARLPHLRYSRESMASSSLIDGYDTAQDSVLHQLLPIAAPDGNAPTEAVRDYVEAIQLADNNVVAYRAHYDVAAKAYNAYLQVHAPELARLGGNYATLQPLPLFELGR